MEFTQPEIPAAISGECKTDWSVFLVYPRLLAAGWSPTRNWSVVIHTEAPKIFCAEPELPRGDGQPMERTHEPWRFAHAARYWIVKR